MSEPELLKFVNSKFIKYRSNFTGSEETKYKKYLEFILVLIDVSTELAKENNYRVNDKLIKDMIKIYFGKDSGPIDDPPNKEKIKKWFDSHLEHSLDTFDFNPELFKGGRKNKRSIKRKTKRRKNKRRKTRKNKI